jgi:hypothetical protein
MVTRHNSVFKKVWEGCKVGILDLWLRYSQEGEVKLKLKLKLRFILVCNCATAECGGSCGW